MTDKQKKSKSINNPRVKLIPEELNYKPGITYFFPKLFTPLGPIQEMIKTLGPIQETIKNDNFYEGYNQGWNDRGTKSINQSEMILKYKQLALDLIKAIENGTANNFDLLERACELTGEESITLKINPPLVSKSKFIKITSTQLKALGWKKSKIKINPRKNDK